MESETDKNNGGLGSAFRYFMESLMGKHSLDSFLSSLSDSVDRFILEQKKEGLIFYKGKCSLTYKKEIVVVELFLTFYNDKHEKIEKHLSKDYKSPYFTSEALQELSKGIMVQDITAPE